MPPSPSRQPLSTVHYPHRSRGAKEPNRPIVPAMWDVTLMDGPSLLLSSLKRRQVGAAGPTAHVWKLSWALSRPWPRWAASPSRGGHRRSLLWTHRFSAGLSERPSAAVSRLFSMTLTPSQKYYLSIFLRGGGRAGGERKSPQITTLVDGTTVREEEKPQGPTWSDLAAAVC